MRIFFAAAAIAAALHAQQPLDVQLLNDPGFESGGLTAWTVLSGTPVAEPYGSLTGIPFPLGAAIQGGNYYLRSSSPAATVRQSIDVSGNAAAIDAGQVDVELDAQLGGLTTDPDTSLLRVRFFNVANIEMANQQVGPVSVDGRNLATGFVRQTQRYLIPAGTRTLKVDAMLQEVNNGLGNPAVSFLDNPALHLRLHAAPATQPYGAELVVNGDFETGDLTGWTIVTGSLVVEAYGSSASVPTVLSAQGVGNGSFLLRGLSGGGEKKVTQRLDVRGNAVDVDAGSLVLSLSADSGGAGADPDHGVLTANFLGALGQVLGTADVGNVVATDRLERTITLRRSATVPVPPLTRTIAIEGRILEVNNGLGNRSLGFLDRASAQLQLASPASPLAYNTELLVNGGFEDTSIVSTTGNSGWRETDPYVDGVLYGTANVPSAAFASSINGGLRLAQALAGGPDNVVAQEFDLSANAADVIAGLVEVHASGYFGGTTTDPDTASMEVHFLGAQGQILSSTILGAVTNAERGNITTMLFRSTVAGVPPLAAGLRVELHLREVNNGGSSRSLALADELSCVLVNTNTGGPYTYPGTGEDLHLFTGLNSLPTGGPGSDIKIAHAHDILNVRIDSFGGLFDNLAIFLICDLFPTGNAPAGILPGIQVGPQNFLLLYSTWPLWHYLAPSGSNYNFYVPPGLATYSVRLQAISIAPLALNGLYASSAAHEIRVQ
jgi:hypothetical protein